MISQHRLNILIRKFLQDECTDEEIAELIRVIREDEDFDLPQIEELSVLGNKSYSLTPEEKVELYESIREKARIRNSSKFQKSYFIYAAAALIVVMLTTLFFRDLEKSAKQLQPSQQLVRINISGDFQPLKDSDTIVLKNSDGFVVGKQMGNKVIYTPSSSSAAVSSNINTMEVPYGKRFELELSDGTQILLNSGSVISYPEVFSEDSIRKVTLSGEAYFDVTHDENRPFVVEAADLNIKVLGTSFNVAAYPEDQTTDVVLVRGSVGMFEDQHELKKQNILSPGFKGSFNRESKSITKQEVETDVYTSWRDGRIVFRNMSFGNILKKLERHFGYKIEIENERLKEEEFNANFGRQSLPEILESFKKIYGIQYEIKNDRVLIK